MIKSINHVTRYMLTYWGYEAKATNNTTMTLIREEVLFSEGAAKAMLEPNYNVKFLQFFVGDGELLLVATENVVSVREIYG